MGTVLIIDDQEDLRYALSTLVSKQGHRACSAASGGEAMSILNSSLVDLVFLDIGLPDISGLQLIEAIKEINDDIDIVMLTGINEAKTAVQALRAGALDYIVKPFEMVEFKAALSRILQTRLMRKKAALLEPPLGVAAIIGNSPPMLRVKEAIGLAATVDAPVLITGETGTGKELVARAIHDSRPGQNGIFVKVDCGTLSANLMESELFGYDKGAFTDARTDKRGLVELAHGGTLFLDEIGNLPIELQPKLLRLIEESTFRKVGGLKDIAVKMRVIAATNADIEEQINFGRFREDLYYRLNVLPIALPPLRRRNEDVLLLAQYFLEQARRDLKKSISGFSAEGQQRLLNHDWPGNIRELRNAIEREVIFSRSAMVSMSAIGEGGTMSSAKKEPLQTLKAMERQYIQKVLAAVDNNKSKAARILGISRTTLREYL